MALTKQQEAELKKKYFAPSASPGSNGLDARIARSRQLSGTTTPETGVERDSVTETTGEAAEPEKKGFFGRAGERIKSAGKDIASSFGRTFRGEQTPVETGVQVVGEVATAGIGTAFDALFSTAVGTIKTLTPKFIEQKVGEGGKALLDSERGKLAIQAISKGEEAYSQFKQEHPRAAANIEGVLGILEIVPASAGKKLLGRGVDVATDVAKTSAQVAKGAVPKVITEPLVQRGLRKTAEAVEEQITPALTKKEIRRAITEGRVTRTTGIKKVLGKADQVVSEQKVKDAAQTIAREIPNARKLTDAQLATEAQNAVARIGESVRPKLKQIDLAEELRNDILDNYLDVKTTQLDDLILSEGQVKKAQKRFEKVVLKLDEAEDIDSLWKLTTEYDKSIPKNIKEATSQSSDALQAQKDIWLENRRILRDALDEAVELADDSVKQEFKDMSGLYTARQNIIASAKFDKGKRSQIRRAFLQGTAAAAGAGTIGVLLID